MEDDISYSSDEDDGDMANDTMGKYHVRSTPLIIIIVVLQSPLRVSQSKI